jgi:hypothetical protein
LVGVLSATQREQLGMLRLVCGSNLMRASKHRRHKKKAKQLANGTDPIRQRSLQKKF